MVHRDLKPSNVLVGNTQDGVVDDEVIIECKLTDFGEARFHSVQMTSIRASSTAHVDRGTLSFQAPEIVLKELTSSKMPDLQKIDVWAFGCVLFCLLNPDIQFPFEEEIKSRVKSYTTIPKDFQSCITSLLRARRLPQTSSVYRDLRQQLPGVETVMKSCLSFDPSKRPATKMILERFSSGFLSVSRWFDTRSGSETHSATIDSNRTAPSPFDSKDYTQSPKYTHRSLGDGSAGEEYGDTTNHPNAINQMTASFQTNLSIGDAHSSGTLTSTDPRNKKSEAGAPLKCIAQTVQIAFHLTRYIEQFKESDLTRIARLCHVIIKCQSSVKGLGIIIKGLERAVSKASTEVALFAAELAGVIHEVQIDVSTLQHTTYDVTRITQALRHEYKYVVFDFSNQIIHIIGAQEHIDKAERFLRSKLFKTEPARQETRAKSVLMPTPSAAEVAKFLLYTAPARSQYYQPTYSEYEYASQSSGSSYHPFTAPERKKGNRYPTTEDVEPQDDDGQPRGTITAVHMDFQLDGCWNKGGTYEIKFNFPAGTYKGRRQSKTTHTAYVQATSVGTRVVKLLKQAFDDGMLFIMGPGGKITWNGVKLITSKHQKAWRGYLPAVIEDLKALDEFTAPELKKGSKNPVTEEFESESESESVTEEFESESESESVTEEFEPEDDDDQPRGTMNAVVRDFQLDGCWNKGGTHEIKFNFPAGTYKGRRQSDTTHTAYAQATSVGTRVVKLLKQAFDDGVLFIMGPGGKITWNGVKLITSKRQKAWRGYLPAVIEDLKALGVYS